MKTKSEVVRVCLAPECKELIDPESTLQRVYCGRSCALRGRKAGLRRDKDAPKNILGEWEALCVDCGVKTRITGNRGNGPRPGFQNRCRKCWGLTERGEDNPNWKGGKSTDSDGYVRVWAGDHPHAWSNGRIFEHVLVMECHLGRLLFEDENVHHKNGVRNDNRFENLELWSTSQPAGQRVEDKLAWAKEIIARYGV